MMDTQSVLGRLREALDNMDTDTDTTVEVSPDDLRHVLELVEADTARGGSRSKT